MDGITFRETREQSDIDAITALHAEVYSSEYGFNEAFTFYVAAGLSEFLKKTLNPREAIWVLEQDGKLLGCVALVEREPTTAQLRWFVLSKEARGQGHGQRMLQNVIAFARLHHYQKIQLWTVNTLTDAAKLYRKFGFEKISDGEPFTDWGAEVRTECYERDL